MSLVSGLKGYQLVILTKLCLLLTHTHMHVLLVRQSGYFGGNTVSDGGKSGELSDDAFMAYSARNKRAVELKM